jgi:RHS repeat-associated protein
MTAISRPDGSTVGYGYDSAGRLQSATAARGSFSYTYDTAGRMQTITTPEGGTLTVGYSGFLPTSISWGGAVQGSLAFSWNNDLRLASETVQGSSITYQYDNDGSITAAGALQLTSDPNTGLLSGTTLGGVSDALSRDTYGDAATYIGNFSGNPIFGEAFTRDGGGRIIKLVQSLYGTSTTLEYGYDARGRLQTVTKDGTEVASYRYDSNGNRISVTTPGGSLTATYDDQDRLLEYGQITYAYGVNDELQTRTDSTGTTTYAYDELGNLLHVGLPGGTQIDYVMDGRSRRVGKKINGTLVRQWLYSDQLHIVAELDGAGALISRFVYGSRPNVPDYMITGGATYRIISDHLGSPRAIIDTATGLAADLVVYDDFGNIQAETSPGLQPFGFAGGLYDRDTNLLRLGARDYDPTTGRWTLRDPIGFNGQSTNLYAYSLSDPVNHVDFTGTVTVPFVGWVNVGENYGSTALASYADMIADPDSTWYQRVGAYVGGAFSALWTPCTSDKTILTLAAAYGANAALVKYGAATEIGTANNPYWRYVGPNSNPNSPWMTRGPTPPYGTDYDAAKEFLQLPNEPTGVQPVDVKWWEPVRGPREVTGNPQWGVGGGTEYARGWGWPPN